jgi:lipoprotein NlpD
MNIFRFTSLAVLIGVMTGCSSTSTRAPVVDRARPAVEVAAPAPVAVRPSDAPGFYTVKKGDTLMRIALDHGQPYRDIVAWNNISNPNEIKVDQVIRIAPPEGGVVTSSVAPPVATEIHKPAPAVVAPAAASAAVNKSGPRADKKPYSEAALAEMQKADGSAAAPAAVAAAKAAPARASEASAEDAVSWMWPADGKVLAGFDEGKNKGIDIGGKLGQHVVAAGAGKIMYAGNAIRGYGNLVIIRHNNNVSSAYAHNAVILVKEEQIVQKGQVIAEMGSSDADAVKLHFEIRQQGKPVDPSKLLPVR